MKKLVNFAIYSEDMKLIKNPSLRLEVADNFWRRFLGLMGRSSLGEADGLLLRGCNAVHMSFMRFALDIIYLDENGKIVKIAAGLRPWVGISACFSAVDAIEMPAGAAQSYALRPGMTIIAAR